MEGFLTEKNLDTELSIIVLVYPVSVWLGYFFQLADYLIYDVPEAALSAWLDL